MPHFTTQQALAAVHLVKTRGYVVRLTVLHAWLMAACRYKDVVKEPMALSKGCRTAERGFGFPATKQRRLHKARAHVLPSTTIHSMTKSSRSKIQRPRPTMEASTLYHSSGRNIQLGVVDMARELRLAVHKRERAHRTDKLDKAGWS